MYSLQDNDKKYNYKYDLNNVILQEQKEYNKLSEAYNLIYKLNSYYQDQIKTHQIEFETLKQKISENNDMQEIILKIDKIFKDFNIKNYSNNVKENIKTLYDYILHLHLVDQENITNLTNLNSLLLDVKNKINDTYDLLKINKDLLTNEEYYNLIFNVVKNIIEENNTANNIDLINKIKLLEDENKKLTIKNDELKQTNSDLNNEIRKLIKLEDEYNDYKIKQEEFLKLSNKTINDIHRKEIINLNEIQKQRIEENKKLLKINQELSKEILELKKGFADLDDYKKQIIMLSKDVNSIKNSVSVQNFEDINDFNDIKQKSKLEFEINKDIKPFNNIEDKTQKIQSRSLNVSEKENSRNKIYPFSKQASSIKITSSKSSKEQLKEWFNNIDNKNRIRKQDIPDIQFKNTSLIILLCKARKYYKLDNTDKMTYGQFKNYLYTISEIRNELL